MMILRSAAASPFGRKVKIAADLLGLHDAVEVVFADTSDPKDSIHTQNPLGKIPVLILDDGTKLFDSRVIVEYLDALAGGGRLIPAALAARWPVLTAAALADGINDAALLMVYERRFRPPELWSQAWTDRQAHIGLACALGYLDLRFAGTWRAEYPALVAWLDAFAADVPAFEATRVKD
jgi:glutathione S-transferase